LIELRDTGRAVYSLPRRLDWKTNVVAGNIELGPVEQRILGCLMEKQRTTPDVYPLSLNALRLACNQSTNRDPVVDYDDTTIRQGVHRLERRGLARLASGAGSRTAKYRHLLAQALPMGDAEQALLCVLLLRGPQTPGELKQRAERMHPFSSLEEVHATLETLIGSELVARHARRPGQKEDRYSHLLGAGDDEPSENGATAPERGSDETAAAATRSPEVQQPAGSAPGEDDSGAHGADAREPVTGADVRAELDALAERLAGVERELADLRAAAASTSRAQDGNAGGNGQDATAGASEDAAPVR
jgi:uncharacterized protein YceH (UPF0502 family)